MYRKCQPGEREEVVDMVVGKGAFAAGNRIGADVLRGIELAPVVAGLPVETADMFGVG